MDCPAYSQLVENHFIHYTSRDGLADGGIISIDQDKTGYLWIACENGLSRFDGYTFKTFRHDTKDTNSLCENRVRCIFLDSKDRIWIISYKWLYLYHSDGEWFEHFSINITPENGLYNICCEENGDLIIGGSKNLIKFNVASKKFTLYPLVGVKPTRFYDYFKDENGIIWCATISGILRYDSVAKQGKFIDSLIKININHEYILVNHLKPFAGNFLLAVSYRNGFYLINRKNCVIKQFFPNPKDRELANRYVYQFNDSVLLLSTDSGLYIYNIYNKYTQNIQPDKLNPASLMENNRKLVYIFRDREGIIWLGNEHLEKYDFKDYRINIIPKDGIERNEGLFNRYFCLYRLMNGSFLMGGYHGMGLYSPETRKLIKFNDKQWYDTFIGNIIDAGNGNFWCTFSSYFNQYTIVKNKLTVLKHIEIPGNPFIVDIKSGQNGKCLLATRGRGFAIYDTLKNEFHFFDSRSNSPSKLTNNEASSVCEAKNGTIWIGTPSGLNKLQKDGVTIKQFGHKENSNIPISEWNISDIKEDKYGAIWFTTREQGIGRVDPNTDSVSFFNLDMGLPTTWSKGLCIDDNDNLWALSKLGMLNINITSLQNKIYGEEEGFPLPDDIIYPDNKNSLYYSKFTKKIYILTPYSIFEIDGENQKHSINNPKVTITSFSVFGKDKTINNRQIINLKYNENFINIDFACLLFHSNKQIKYAYRMEGIDKDWVYCNYKRNAPYTNVPPGHYTFLVKSQSPDGVWNSPTSLEIIIMPPFWETWWFILLEIFAAAGLTLWIVRLYTERKLALQKSEFEKLQAISTERTRIASDMHDDLGAGLTSIRLLSEVVNLKTSEENPTKPEIEKIVNSAGKLSDNLREIIWTMSAKDDKLEDFIIYVRTYSAGFFDGSSIQFHFSRPEVIPELIMHGELRRNLFLCIKEAMNNIMKHSKATEASLSFILLGNMLITEIKDNGKGFDTSNSIRFGNGIASMKSRLSKFEGKMEIESSLDGTKVVFSILI